MVLHSKHSKTVILKAYHPILSTNVLVLFYTPNCPHSLEFLQIFEKFSQDTDFISGKKLLCAKINIDKNSLELPMFGYPNLKLWSANFKSFPIDFEYEEISIPSLKKFVNENLQKI